MPTFQWSLFIMRPRSSLIQCGQLLLVILTLAPPLRAAPAARKAATGVTVTVEQRIFVGHAPIQITVHNNLGQPIALPGCASFGIEQFIENRFIPLPPRRCDWEQEAVTVPRGEHLLQFQPTQEGRVILRAVVTYGVGCKEKAPLSQARCERFNTAYSHYFTLMPAAG